MYMMSLKSQVTPIAVTVVDGVHGTLDRLNPTHNHTKMKDMAAAIAPVGSPIPPTKGTKLESQGGLGVIEEEEEEEVNVKVACNTSGTSESPAERSVPSLPVKTFQYFHIPRRLASTTGDVPENELTTAHPSTAAETRAGHEKTNHTDQFRGSVPPSSLDIAFMKLRLTRAPYISSMLNPDSDGVRLFPPLERYRAMKNDIFLKALDNYALRQAAKAEEAARARAETIEQDEDNEQFMLVPPEDYDDVLAEYIIFDAQADDIAERQAKAYAWCDMDDDDYY